MSHRALILCTGNSCRSQMAEGLWRHEGHGQWRVESAGSKPAGYVHPMAVQVMSEVGINISGNASKNLDQFVDQNFDVVVTVCDNAAQDCPAFHHAHATLHWPFEDPAHAEGSEEERLAAFRTIREQIASKIRDYLAADSSG